MFKNYFKTAIRNFWRNKTFSVINVLGLSIGISAALVMFIIVYYEFSFDTYQPDPDRIYRVVLDAKFGDNEGHSTGVPAPLGGAIASEITGIELTVPVFTFQRDATAKVAIVTTTKNQPVVYKKQTDIIFTNNDYFKLLDIAWLAGSKSSAMQNAFSVVLTKSRAKQYFPDASVSEILGRHINYNDDLETTVAGVVEDVPAASSFAGKEFISLATITKTNLQQNFMMTVWNDWMAYAQVYVKLSKNISVKATESQLQKMYSKYNKDAHKDDNNYIAFHLQPLIDIHFNSMYPSVGQRVADRSVLYGLLGIAAFLLLLGCINFINLTTAQATKRTKEIGIRKTMGSTRKQLVFQFLAETFFVTFIATLISLAIMPLLLNMFTDYIPPGLHADVVGQPRLMLFLFFLTVLVSFLSGIYPALILSGYKPVTVLKGQSNINNTGQTRSAWVRKTLTVSQFVIAQFFIIATFMVSKQIHYTLNADMGFKKEAIINFEMPWDTVATHGKLLLQQIQALPEVEVAATGFMSPASSGVAFTNISAADKKDVKENVQLRWGDENYFKVYQLQLIGGRNVEPGDTMKEFIINETYAKILGYKKPSDALNRYLVFNDKNMPIVGVMKDFHDQSFHAPIGAVAFAGGSGSTFHIRLKPNNGSNSWQQAIGKIGKAFKQLYPNEDFNYTFFDETIAKLYEHEAQTARLLTWATALSILISCLGLFGLVLYITNTRTKEIGIRKILGASVATIVSNLSKDFIKLVVLAFVLAAPLAGWVTYSWLQNFAYRTTLNWWVFALSGAGMLLLAIITLSIQTVKAAIANPVISLRSE
jgi:putative ABC transport system permease protein